MIERYAAISRALSVVVLPIASSRSTAAEAQCEKLQQALLASAAFFVAVVKAESITKDPCGTSIDQPFGTIAFLSIVWFSHVENSYVVIFGLSPICCKSCAINGAQPSSG